MQGLTFRALSKASNRHPTLEIAQGENMRFRKKLTTVFATFSLIVVGLPLCRAQVTDRTPEWEARLGSIDVLLTEGKWKKAQKQCEELSHEMVNEILWGDSTARLVGTVTALRSIALAGRGKRDDALWFWQVAKQLYAPIAELDTEKYRGLRVDLKAPQEEKDRVVQQIDDNEKPTPPIKKKGDKPWYPHAKRYLGRHVSIVVEVVIGKDGRPRWPSIIESKGEPTMVLEVLDAMNTWRFKPSKLNGEPISVEYVMTARFDPS